MIHSLYFPSFRTKIDAIPGRYMELWFEPTKPGTYHIFCAEYCGTNHSGMIGSVIVMEPPAYQAWLAGGGEGSLAERGAALFKQLACNTCHLDSGQGRGPSLKDIFGKPVELADGSKVTVDEVYLRESILTSQAKIVKGFQPLMPTFQGLISEEGLVALIEHVRSLSPNAPGTTSAAPAAPAAPGAGAALFNQLACNTCHLDSGQGRGPSLKDIFGKPVELADGTKVMVDEVYLRESILKSQAKIVKGFQPLMPTFQGLISEEGLVALIEHVRSMSPNAHGAGRRGAQVRRAATDAPGAGDKSAPPPAKGRQ